MWQSRSLDTSKGGDVTEQKQTSGQEPERDPNAVRTYTMTPAENRRRQAELKKKREENGPVPKPPKRKVQTLEVKGVPVAMYRQLEMMARRSNLTVGQLALLGLEMLLTGGPDGKPMTLPKWKDVLDY